MAAQVEPNRALAYLSPADVTDARALWVNPAGLGREREASVHVDLTVGDPGGDARLRQITLGFNSRGLSFGYQRDVFDGGLRGHTYRLGLGAGRGGLAAGLAAALYRGGTKGTSWDFGVVYEPAAKLALGAVLRNVNQPVVRGIHQVATLVPHVTLKPLGRSLALSADGQFTVDSVLGYSVDARLQGGGRLSLGLLVRLDVDRTFRRTMLLLGVSVGGRGQVGMTASLPGDAGRVDAANLYGVAVGTPER